LEAEAEVHPHSIPVMAAVDVHTVVKIHILQVEIEKEEVDTKVVSSVEVGTQASVDRGSAAVVVAVADSTSHVEVGVAETHTWSVVVENTRSV
jgi:hypothetical protein